jgi:hypothetical protein
MWLSRQLSLSHASVLVTRTSSQSENHTGAVDG